MQTYTSAIIPAIAVKCKIKMCVISALWVAFQNYDPHIKNYLVIPYLSFNVHDKELFDSIIYPDGFEKYNFKSAIPARNRYMVDNSGYAICYVTHSWGGAAKTYERAKKRKLQIINLGAKEDGERKSDIQ